MNRTDAVAMLLGWIVVVPAAAVAAAVAAAAGATAPAGGPATAAAERKDVEVVIAPLDPGATSISGKVENAPPADVFFKLAQIAKVGFSPNQDGLWDDPTLQNVQFSAEWDRQPFWEALKEACEATGTKPTIETQNADVPRIRLERGDMSRSPAAIDGPALLRPTQFVRTATVSYANNARQADRVRLSFSVLLEPKVRKYAWIDAPVIDEAKDEKGTLLKRAGDGGGEGFAYLQGDVSTLLEYPDNAGHRLAMLRGSITARVPKEMATITFADPFVRPRELSAKVGEHKLVLAPVTGDAKSGWQVKLKLVNGAPRPEANPLWQAIASPFGSFGAPVAAIGADGAETLMAGGGGSSSGDEASIDASFPARPPGAPEGAAGIPPAALRVELPVSFQPVKVKFEFKDLPLP